MIYVDLDNTLIDSIARYQKEFAIAERHGISAEEYWRIFDVLNKRHGIGSFGYELFFQILKEFMPQLPNALLVEWHAVLETPHPFPDTYEFLSAFPKEKLILLTTGNPAFQRKKIIIHELEPYFAEIKIVMSPKCRHVVPPDGAIYLDDSPREIDEMKELHPHVHCVLMRKTPPWERRQKISLKKDAYCRDLLEARDHIKNLPSPSI